MENMMSMFAGKDAATASNPSYPTQWALNPNAYQNIDSSTVDWAALAQQWIAMKEAAAILATPSGPSASSASNSSKLDAEEGEAPMEVENPDAVAEPVPPPDAEWNATTNSWNAGGWNQWGWGWDGAEVDPKIAADPSMGMGSMMGGYNVPSDGSRPIPGFGSSPAPTFQHGYWTAPQPDSPAGRGGRGDRRSKSKGREHKTIRSRPREKPPLIPPVIEPIVPAAPMLDAAKRRQLPAWIREGLEKMEREKQKAIEREQEKKAREEAEREKKRREEEELERMKAEAGGQPMMPAKSKFDSESEAESDSGGRGADGVPPVPPPPSMRGEWAGSAGAGAEPEPLPRRSKEEIMHEVMLLVRVSLTEILLEVTDAEIHTVSSEELARYTQAQASRLNAMRASNSSALASIANGLGLGAYESSSEDSEPETPQNTDVSDHQLQEIIRRKKADFERTSREIEAEVRRAELREAASPPDTPDPPDPPAYSRDQSSPTPPPESDTPEKLPERRPSKDRKNHKSSDRVDGLRRNDSHEEKPKRKRDHTPSPKNNHKKETSSSTSDSGAGSSSTSSETSASEREAKIEKKAKKRKRKSSSSSESRRQPKKHKKEKSYKSDEKRDRSSKSRYYDDYEKEKSRSKRKDDYYERDRRKSSRSREYERSHKDKYREESEERARRRRRSRSVSYESRSGRRERTRERERERDRYSREREHDRYDRRRTRSRERHRR